MGESWGSKDTTGLNFSQGLRVLRREDWVHLAIHKWIRAMGGDLVCRPSQNAPACSLGSPQAFSCHPCFSFSQMYPFSSLRNVVCQACLFPLLLLIFLAIPGFSFLSLCFSAGLTSDSPRFPWPWQTKRRLGSGADKGKGMKEIIIILMKLKLPKQVSS